MPRILNPDYTTAEWVTAKPICGEDFCNNCGDCLACYGDDECPYGAHSWVVYADEAEAFRVEHGVAPLPTR